MTAALVHSGLQAGTATQVLPQPATTPLAGLPSQAMGLDSFPLARSRLERA